MEVLENNKYKDEKTKNDVIDIFVISFIKKMLYESTAPEDPPRGHSACPQVVIWIRRTDM